MCHLTVASGQPNENASVRVETHRGRSQHVPEIIRDEFSATVAPHCYGTIRCAEIDADDSARQARLPGAEMSHNSADTATPDLLRSIMQPTCVSSRDQLE